MKPEEAEALLDQYLAKLERGAAVDQGEVSRLSAYVCATIYGSAPDSSSVDSRDDLELSVREQSEAAVRPSARARTCIGALASDSDPGSSTKAEPSLQPAHAPQHGKQQLAGADEYHER